MKLLLLASTEEEIGPTLSYLEENWEKKSFFEYKYGSVSVYPLISGMGGIFSALSIARYPEISEIDYIINPGLGAGVSRTLDLGRVYLLEEERFGDIGLEETDGSFNDLHDLKWQDPNKYPFLKGKLYPKTLINPTFLPTSSGITVNKIPGTSNNIDAFTKKYHSDIITMDGAAIMYTCRMLDIEIISYRVISRYVEPWQINVQKLGDHIDQLHIRTKDILEHYVRES